MANPPHLFGADGRLNEQVLQSGPWSVGVVDKIGPGPRSSYVEDFSLRILGPSAASRLSADERAVKPGHDRRQWGSAITEAVATLRGQQSMSAPAPATWPRTGAMPPDEGNE